MFTVIANLGYSGVDDGFSVLEQVQDLGVVLFVFCFERRSYGSRDFMDFYQTGKEQGGVTPLSVVVLWLHIALQCPTLH